MAPAACANLYRRLTVAVIKVTPTFPKPSFPHMYCTLWANLIPNRTSVMYLDSSPSLSCGPAYSFSDLNLYTEFNQAGSQIVSGRKIAVLCEHEQGTASKGMAVPCQFTMSQWCKQAPDLQYFLKNRPLIPNKCKKWFWKDGWLLSQRFGVVVQPSTSPKWQWLTLNNQLYYCRIKKVSARDVCKWNKQKDCCNIHLNRVIMFKLQ